VAGAKPMLMNTVAVVFWFMLFEVIVAAGQNVVHARRERKAKTGRW